MTILGHDRTAKMCQCDIWHRLQFSPQATTAGHKTENGFFRPKGGNIKQTSTCSVNLFTTFLKYSGVGFWLVVGLW